MQSYLRLFSTAIQERIAYKVAFFLWRFRQLLATAMSLTIWTVLFQNQSNLFQYSQSEMITYIFLVAVLQSVILTSALHGLANDVYSGKISTLLVKPIRLFSYLGLYELADKALNVFFIFGEALILYFLFQPILIFPEVTHLLLFVAWMLGGMYIHFCINLLFGAIGFWSPDVWGAKFLFFMLLDFTAGKLYPLDILPIIIQGIVSFTPFPYLSYAQTQLFLGRYSNIEILAQSAIIIFWCFLLGYLSHIVWKKSLQSYSAVGQ